MSLSTTRLRRVPALTRGVWQCCHFHGLGTKTACGNHSARVILDASSSSPHLAQSSFRSLIAVPHFFAPGPRHRQSAIEQHVHLSSILRPVSHLPYVGILISADPLSTVSRKAALHAWGVQGPIFWRVSIHVSMRECSFVPTSFPTSAGPAILYSNTIFIHRLLLLCA